MSDLEQTPEVPTTQETTASVETVADEGLLSQPKPEGVITSIEQLKEKAAELEKKEETSKEVEAESEKVVEKEKEKEEVKETGATEEYKPDFKFKVTNKEFEIPEKFRSLIKTKEDEAEIKDLFTKAFGIENIKAREFKLKEENDFFKAKVLPAFEKQDQIVSELATYWKNKDFDSYFERLGADVKDLEKWMYQRLSMTPEQQALYEAKRLQQKQVYELQAENQKFKEQIEGINQKEISMQEEKVRQALDFALNKNENKDVVKAYDEINGQGSFQKKVIEYAAFVFGTEKKQISPDEAVSKVKQFIGPIGQQQSNATAQTATPKEKPVLPRVNAKPYSPAAKKVKSIDDIRARYQELSNT